VKPLVRERGQEWGYVKNFELFLVLYVDVGDPTSVVAGSRT
jgi:hypothetical protein